MLIETENLTRKFPGEFAVRGVNFRVEAGEIRGLIGPNGAGKSTLLHLLIGKELPTIGKVKFKGKDVTKERIYDRVKMGMGIKFQITSIFEEQTVYGNLVLAAQKKTSYAKLAKSKVDDLLANDIEMLADSLMLKDKLDVFAGDLAYGEKQWLEIAMVLASKPDLILLDEPTAGMSKDETAKTEELIAKIKENNHSSTFVVVEHDIEFIKSLCGRISVLHQGEIIAEGNPKEVESDPFIRKIYLGED